MIIAFSFLGLLNSDYESKIKEFNQFNESNWLHFDVMDGKFVTNKTFNHLLVEEINEYNILFSDVHLMIKKPGKEIRKYAKAGADQLTFHYESVKSRNIVKIIKKIKRCKMKVGISIKPGTNIEVLDSFLGMLDYILVMSVEPGKGGQNFITSSLEKIKYLKDKRKDYHYLIGVDGGVNDETSILAKRAGADVVVVGTYLANNLNLETLNKLK